MEMSTQNLLKREIDGKADKGLFETLSQSYFNLSNSYVNNTVYLDTTQIITGQKVFHIHPYLPSVLPSNVSQSVSRLHVENYLLGYATTTSFAPLSSSYLALSSSFVNVSTSYASVSSSLNTRFTSQSVFIPLSNSFVSVSSSYNSFSSSFINFSTSVDQQIKDIVGGSIDTSSLVTISNFNNYTSSIVVPLSNSFVSVSSSYNSFSSSFESFSQSVSSSLANITIDPFPYTGSAEITGSLIVTGSVTVSELSGSGDRVILTDANGKLFASEQTVIQAYIDPTGSVAGYLNNTGSWSIYGVYTGVPITGTFQGQKHYNSDYFFEAVDDNVWIRLIRG